MLGGVGGVLELLQDNSTGSGVAQGLCLTDSTRHAVLTRGETHFGTVGFHEVSTLHAHGFRHGQNQVVALDSADQRQSDTSIAAGGFDDGGAGLQNALLLSVLNHRKSDAVLHAAAWVEILYFGDDGCVKAFCL